MGRYITPAPATAQSGKIKKQQVFTVSGTFTPSQALLDAGGVVEVRCIGGGGGGYGFGGGSSGMDITRIVTVTGPVAVTIGAGGESNSQGGQTNFGTLLTALGGNKSNYHQGGLSSGEGSQAGESVFAAGSTTYRGRGGGYGGGGSTTTNGSASTNARPNTGGGGGGDAAYSYSKGGSGLCIITWEE